MGVLIIPEADTTLLTSLIAWVMRVMGLFEYHDVLYKGMDQCFCITCGIIFGGYSKLSVTV